MDPTIAKQDEKMRKYGRAARPRKGPLGRLSGKGRKYFDSADNALSAAGVKTETGKVIATTQNIPRRTHAKPTGMVDQTQEVISKDDEEANQENQQGTQPQQKQETQEKHTHEPKQQDSATSTHDTPNTGNLQDNAEDE